MTVLSKSWEPVPHPGGFALVSMLHRTLHGCRIITHKHCIFVHLQPSPFPRIRHPPICSQYLCVQCLFFPCDMYMRASVISFLCEFLTREPHQSPDRILPWIPCEARMKPALEGEPQAYHQEPCLPFQPFQNGPLTTKTRVRDEA